MKELSTATKTEVSAIKRQVSNVAARADEIKIKSDQDYLAATDILSKVKEVGKTIKERKEAITKPLLEALNSARDLFRPLETIWLQAERIIKEKMLAYKMEQDKIAREKEAKIAEKVDSGRLSFEKASDQIASIPRISSTVEGKRGGVVTARKIKKVLITKPDLVPDKYWVIDEIAVRRDALTGVEIPGVQVVEEEILSAR